MAMFEPKFWLEREELDPEIVEALPRGTTVLTGKELLMLEEWFGPKGMFPAAALPAGTNANFRSLETNVVGTSRR